MPCQSMAAKALSRICATPHRRIKL